MYITPFLSTAGDACISSSVLYFQLNSPSGVMTYIYTSISLGVFDSILIQYIGFIVSAFLGGLIAGRTGEKKGGSFGGWFLTSMLSAAALVLLLFLSPGTLATLIGPIIDPIPILVLFLVNGVIMGIFYGCFALLFTKTEYY